MRISTTKALMAGVAAGFLGLTMAQGAKADYMYITRFETTTTPTMFLQTTPTVSRVITSPVVVETPTTTVVPTTLCTPTTMVAPTTLRTIEQPVVIERKEGHHLLNLKLF